MTLSNYAVAPGEYIQEWLEAVELSDVQLGRRMGISEQHIAELMQGSPLTTAGAKQLEDVTGIPYTFWLEAEKLYRADLQRLTEIEERSSP